MIDKHLVKLRARDHISAEEEAAIRASVRDVITVRPRGTVVRAHDRIDVCTILLSGIAARRKDMEDGRSQIIELQVAGDFTDLHSFTLKYLDHDIIALTQRKFAVVPHEALRLITERLPHLTRIYWFATNLDAAINREWELSLARRDAAGRMAHLFCEMYIRLGLVGLADNFRYELPLTQETLGEVLGLTPVHVNRTLQQMRADGHVQFEKGHVTIRDWDTLQRVAQFDPTYLYLDRQSR